ncbi:MAG: hypothetical protein HEEMFOPI_01752 [Holosporales bacterium]
MTLQYAIAAFALSCAMIHATEQRAFPTEHSLAVHHEPIHDVTSAKKKLTLREVIDQLRQGINGDYDKLRIMIVVIENVECNHHTTAFINTINRLCKNLRVLDKLNIIQGVARVDPDHYSFWQNFIELNPTYFSYVSTTCFLEKIKPGMTQKELQVHLQKLHKIYYDKTSVGTPKDLIFKNKQMDKIFTESSKKLTDIAFLAKKMWAKGVTSTTPREDAKIKFNKFLHDYFKWTTDNRAQQLIKRILDAFDDPEPGNVSLKLPSKDGLWSKIKPKLLKLEKKDQETDDPMFSSCFFKIALCFSNADIFSK